MSVNLKLKESDLKGKKLFVATPMYGGMCSGMFARSIADVSALSTNFKIALQLFFLFNESLITRARNYIADEFMRSGAEHLMFIDSDIGFDARDVIALMALQFQNKEFDIIGGAYPKKCISWEKVVQAVNSGKGDKNPQDLEKYVGDFVFNPKGGTQRIPINTPVEVMEIGTGFMMISRSAMERFQKAYPEYYYRPDHIRTEHFDGSREILQFFQAEIDQIDYGKEYRKLLDDILAGKLKADGNQVDLKNAIKNVEEEAKKASKRYLSEDYWFSQKSQKLGIRTFLCPWMKLTHMGSYVFGGSLMDLASVGASATADADLVNKSKQKKTA